MKLIKPDEVWQKNLTADQYRVLRKKGTEGAFSNEYWNHHESGVYACAGCRQVLFSSKAKYDSGTGWPSFTQPVSEHVVQTVIDDQQLPMRTEVVCSICDGHLGHVFEDGPAPTYLRYCMNSAALSFRKD